MLLCLPVLAQDGGSVSGVVVSTWDGTPLGGATVTVRGTTLAVQTTPDGLYELKGVPPGDQELRFSKSGFATANVTDVRVLPGQKTTVNGNLRPEYYEMEEYEVTAEEFQEQTEQIMFEKQQSGAMMDAIGSEQFSKLGAGDAAEALSKVSGASIADGKFAVIRGLADRYTTTTLNGTELPSADPDRKSAQLDLLPSQFIDRMDVSKTFSPDMAGGFAGGSINIVTKSYPEDGTFSFSVGTSYNTQASLNDEFPMTDRGDMDWLAMDDGTRELPAVAVASSPAGSGGPVQNETAVQNSFKSTQLSPIADKSPLNSSLSLAYGDSAKLGEVKVGFLGSFNYKNDYSFYDDVTVRKYESPTVISKDKVGDVGKIEYTWGASSGLTLGFGEHHEVNFNYLFVQAAEDEAARFQGQDVNVGTEPGETYLDQSYLHWTERNLSYYQLVGSHELPDLNDLKFDWAGAFSTATQEEPDYRIFQFVANTNNSVYLPQAATEPAFPTRYWRDLEENNINLRGDFTVPLPSYNEGDNAFKTGVALSDSSREFFQRGWEMRYTSLGHPFIRNGDPQSYLDPTNAAFIEYRNFPANITYDGSQTIEAAYAMGDWSALDWLRLVGGVRLEKTDLSVEGVNQTLNNRPLPSGEIKRDDWLPALSGTISLRENLQMRAAWSQTVVRPAYREIAPVVIYDIAQGRTISGNPDLTFAESANYDLRLEWFPRAGELVSASLFYKQVDKPIELSAEDFGGDSLTYRNFDQADVMGVELEYRSRLDRLWDPLSPFTLGFNAAYIYSEVPLTPDQITIRQGAFGSTDTTRPLFDQPEYVINADLTWDLERTGTSITLSGGIVGPRLVVVGLALPDEYEQPAPQLDLFISQKLGKNWKLKFSAKNLLNPEYETTQTYPNGDEVTLESYTKGLTFGLSLGCEF